MQSQQESKTLVYCLKLLICSRPQYIPIPVPDSLGCLVDSGDSRPGTVGPFRVIKLASVDIAQGQMGKINIFNVPSFALTSPPDLDPVEKRSAHNRIDGHRRLLHFR